MIFAGKIGQKGVPTRRSKVSSNMGIFRAKKIVSKRPNLRMHNDDIKNDKESSHFGGIFTTFGGCIFSYFHQKSRGGSYLGNLVPSTNVLSQHLDDVEKGLETDPNNLNRSQGWDCLKQMPSTSQVGWVTYPPCWYKRTSEPHTAQTLRCKLPLIYMGFGAPTSVSLSASHQCKCLYG